MDGFTRYKIELYHLTFLLSSQSRFFFLSFLPSFFLGDSWSALLHSSEYFHSTTCLLLTRDCASKAVWSRSDETNTTSKPLVSSSEPSLPPTLPPMLPGLLTALVLAPPGERLLPSPLTPPLPTPTPSSEVTRPLESKAVDALRCRRLGRGAEGRVRRLETLS